MLRRVLAPCGIARGAFDVRSTPKKTTICGRVCVMKVGVNLESHGHVAHA